jgi:hypothetical protein
MTEVSPDGGDRILCIGHKTSPRCTISVDRTRQRSRQYHRRATLPIMAASASADEAPHEQFPFPIATGPSVPEPSRLPDATHPGSGGKTIYILLPVFVILATLLILLVVFLIGIIYNKRRRGIRLVEDGGPLDLSRNDGVIGEGGIEGVESRWLEEVSEDVRQGYARAKGKSRTLIEWNRSSKAVALKLTALSRLPITIPSVFPRNRYHPFTVPFDTGERCFRVVLRARLRIKPVHVCRVPHRNNLPGRWSWNGYARGWSQYRPCKSTYTKDQRSLLL